MKNTHCVLLPPGRESALQPLTRDYCLFSLPLGGKNLLADVPLSNALHSGLRNLSLLSGRPGVHLGDHLRSTYPQDPFSPGVLEVIKVGESTGTAQKLQEAWNSLTCRNPDRIILLFGGELFRMDLRELLQCHVENHHDITLSIRPVSASEAQTGALAKLTPRGMVQELGHAPYPQGLEEWMAPQDYLLKVPDTLRSGFYAPFGAMVFETAILEQLLSHPKQDFFRDILSDGLWDHRTGVYLFGGHWSDLTTVRNFHQASLNLASIHPTFNLYDTGMPLISPPGRLPPAKVNFGTFSQVLASDGVIVNNGEISNSLLGLRTVVDSGVKMDGVVTFGSDTYEDPRTQSVNRSRGIPHLGIGRGSLLRNCILGRNTRIGEGCRLGADPLHRPDQDMGTYSTRDGIIIIPDDTVIPPGTIL